MATGWQRIRRALGIHLKLRDPPNVPPYGWSYFDHLVAVFLTLNASDPRASAIIKKASDDPDALTWGDIFLFENVIFSLQPVPIVERNAWILRERLRETACSTIYDKYIDSQPPKETDTPAKIALLRADLTRVLDVLHWHYSLIPIREHLRTSLTINCIWFVVLYTIALVVALLSFQRHGWDFAAMLVCVLYFGIIGGFVSSQRRMQSIPTDTDPLISIFGLDSAGYFLWLSPLLGAIFAAVLMLMFVAGFLKGTVFPNFPKLPHATAYTGFGFFDTLHSSLPTGSEEYAKLYVWAFLAGFAERLVPDSLDRLAGKMGSSKPSTAAAPSGPSLMSNFVPGEGNHQPNSPVSASTLDAALRTGVKPMNDPEPAEGDSSGDDLEVR